MLLYDLSVDFWREMNTYLSFWYVYRLYACGDARLNVKLALRGGITDFKLIFVGGKRSLGWVPLIQHFSHIRRFVYDTGGMTTNSYYFPTKSDLMMLPGTLEEFVMHSDGAENAFWAEEHADTERSGCVHGKHLMISEIWPNLRLFDVIQYSSYAYKLRVLGEALTALPETLQSVKLRCSDAYNFLRHFPRGMERLAMQQGELTEALMLDLPPQLLELSASLIKTGTLNPHILANLPRSIISINITSDLNAECIQYLPMGLTYLSASFPNEAHLPAEIAYHLLHLKYLIWDWETSSTACTYDIPIDAPPLRYIPFVKRRHDPLFYSWAADRGWTTIPPHRMPAEKPLYFS